MPLVKPKPTDVRPDVVNRAVTSAMGLMAMHDLTAMETCMLGTILIKLSHPSVVQALSQMDGKGISDYVDAFVEAELNKFNGVAHA